MAELHFARRAAEEARRTLAQAQVDVDSLERAVAGASVMFGNPTIAEALLAGQSTLAGIDVDSLLEGVAGASVIFGRPSFAEALMAGQTALAGSDVHSLLENIAGGSVMFGVRSPTQALIEGQELLAAMSPTTGAIFQNFETMRIPGNTFADCFGGRRVVEAPAREQPRLPAPNPEPEAPSQDSDIEELRWMLAEVLDQNEHYRCENAELHRQLRVWELMAAMDWATRPFPDLDSEEFEKN